MTRSRMAAWLVVLAFALAGCTADVKTAAPAGTKITAPAAAKAATPAAAAAGTLLLKDKVKTGQYPESFDTHAEECPKYNCQIYIPEDYAKAKGPWPLVIFLHGSGESGSDIEKVKVNGPPKLIAAGKTYPAIIVSPQHPGGRGGGAPRPAAAPTSTAAASAAPAPGAPAAPSGRGAGAPTGRGGGGWQPKAVGGLVEELQKNYDIDPNRIYLTGLSMGGMGSWALAIDQPARFAAVAPICGRGDATRVVVLKDVPIWVFHGAKDTAVPIKGAQDMVDALKAAGGSPKFTIYPDAGHDSWTATYDDPQFWAWLFQQHR